MKPSLLILAAGIGSRFGGFKQMRPVGPCGELLIDYSIFDARKGGFGTIIFIISPQIEADFRKHMELHYGTDAGFVYVCQELDAIPAGFSVPAGRVKPWGTVHAVMSAEGAVDAPFAVINADDYYGPGSFKAVGTALGAMKPEAAEFYMVGFELSKTLSDHGTVARGVCTVKDDHLVSIVEHQYVCKSGSAVVYKTAAGEHRPLAPRSIVSMNFWGFAPTTLYPFLKKNFTNFLRKSGNDIKAECYLPTVINNGLADKSISVEVLHSGEQWFGMTYVEDLDMVREYVRQKIKNGMYPERLFF